MVNGRFGATFRQIETLVRIGAVGLVSDGQLLERFLDRREGGEAAFEALVARHGGMVLGVCRQVLGTDEGAEDAFQATFLVLVRQAGSIQKRESLGPWLHGVARRVSLRAKRDAARRRERERHGFKVVGGCAPDEALAATLHDEIARLPEKYRTPIVLCDLEGQSHAEAARRLDWPIGTVSGRLSRARALLRSRIARRGVALSMGALAAALGSSARAAATPSLISRATSNAVNHLGGQSVAPSVSALASSGLSGTGRSLSKIAAGFLVTVVGLGGAIALRDGPSPQPARPAARVVSQESGMRPHPRLLQDEQSIIAATIAPDGLSLASGGLDARVVIWDLETGLEKAVFRGHTAAVTSVSYTHDGQYLSSTSDDHTIKVWDVASGREALSVTWLDPDEGQPNDLGPESIDSGRSAPGRDRCADGSVREGDLSGA